MATRGELFAEFTCRWIEPVLGDDVSGGMGGPYELLNWEPSCTHAIAGPLFDQTPTYCRRCQYFASNEHHTDSTARQEMVPHHERPVP